MPKPATKQQVYDAAAKAMCAAWEKYDKRGDEQAASAMALLSIEIANAFGDVDPIFDRARYFNICNGHKY